MQSIKIKAPAKLNLNLNVLPIVREGFHQIKFLNTEIKLADEITIEKTKSSILVKCKNADCHDKKCPQKCLAYQAAELLKKEFPKNISGVKVFIKKNIPSRAGLGGGSSDAAAVLKGMNQLYDLKLSQRGLIKRAVKISTDACYSVVGGLCEVSGIGEKIKPLAVKFPKYHLLIVVPKIKKPSTKWCYENLNAQKIGKNLQKFKKFISSLSVSRYTFHVIRYLHNDFENLIFSEFSEVQKMKEKLLDLGAEKTILAGSGLSLVGFFKNKTKALNAKRIFRNCILTKIL